MNIVSPYASKAIGDRKLFARNHGIQQDLVQGQNTIEFNAIYATAKIVGVEIIGGETLDYADFKVYAGATMLNQFAYTMNVAKDYYRRESKFDADFVSGIKIVIEYYSQSAKRIGVNFLMDEVK